MESEKVIRWYLRGWVLVCALVAFWPVGLLLVLGRIKTDRSFHAAAARTLQIIGWVLTILATIVFLIGLVGFSSESDKGVALAGIATCILLIVGGVILIRRGSKLGSSVVLRRRLSGMIVNENRTSVDSMASALACSVEEAMESVETMIAEGFLPGFKLDPDTRFLSRRAQEVANSRQARLIQFTCAGCGAHNSVTTNGSSLVCEYCDTPVSVTAR